MSSIAAAWASAWDPPPELSISEWADASRHLPQTSAARGGRWRTSSTPYLKGIMDAAHDMTVSKIALMKCHQSGGSEGLNNIIGYHIEHDPWRALSPPARGIKRHRGASFSAAIPAASRGLRLVVDWDGVALAAFFLEPQPPALALLVVVLDAHADDGRGGFRLRGAWVRRFRWLDSTLQRGECCAYSKAGTPVCKLVPWPRLVPPPGALGAPLRRLPSDPIAPGGDLESRVPMIEKLAERIPPDLLGRSGSVFYSGRAAFSSQASLYILGLNPGGNPKEQSPW